MAARHCCFCGGLWTNEANAEVPSPGAERSWQGLNSPRGCLEALEMGFLFLEAAVVLTSVVWTGISWERREDISPPSTFSSQRFRVSPTGLWLKLRVASSGGRSCVNFLRRGFIRKNEFSRDQRRNLRPPVPSLQLDSWSTCSNIPTSSHSITSRRIFFVR